MKSNERDKPILEYVQCMYNNVHTYKERAVVSSHKIPETTQVLGCSINIVVNGTS